MMSASLLRQFQSLSAFTDAELETLIAVTQKRTVSRGEVLCREGAPGASCFLIMDGAFEVMKQMNGSEQVISRMKPGDFIGQMALVDRRPRSATVRAETPAVCLEFSRDQFERLLHAQSSLGLRFQEQIAIASVRQLRKGLERLQKVARERPRHEKQVKNDENVLHLVQAAMGEWGVSLDELDSVEVVRPDGVMSAAEKNSRRRTE